MTTTGFTILETLLYACDESCILYGGYVRDSLDQSLGLPSKDLDVLISPKGLEKFSMAMKKLGARTLDKKLQENYESTTFSVTLNNQEILVDCSLPSSTQGWCDFTCNNLQMSTTDQLSTRCCPLPNRGNFLFTCIQDIQAKRLIPMCPLSWLTLDTRCNRQRYVSLVFRALKMMSRGWTLGPHLQGGELEFTVVEIEACPQGGVQPVYNRCTICQEDITKPWSGVELSCSHCYHIDCLKTLMCGSGPSSYKCPVCKQDIKF